MDILISNEEKGCDSDMMNILEEAKEMQHLALISEQVNEMLHQYDIREEADVFAFVGHSKETLEQISNEGIMDILLKKFRIDSKIKAIGNKLTTAAKSTMQDVFLKDKMEEIAKKSSSSAENKAALHITSKYPSGRVDIYREADHISKYIMDQAKDAADDENIKFTTDKLDLMKESFHKIATESTFMTAKLSSVKDVTALIKDDSKLFKQLYKTAADAQKQLGIHAKNKNRHGVSVYKRALAECWTLVTLLFRHAVRKLKIFVEYINKYYQFIKNPSSNVRFD